jgi:hypothetical protein
MSEENKKLYHIYTNVVNIYSENFIKNFPKIANHISNYINKRSDVLSTRNVGLHLLYTQSIENNFFECAGVDRDEIIRIVNESETIDKRLNDAKNPLYNILMVMISFYYIHQKEMEELYGTKVAAWKFIRTYLGLKVYSMAQRYIFHYEPKEEVMDYVLSTLNNRFDIVKVPNIYTLIEQDLETNNERESGKVDFKKLKDPDVYGYVNYLYNRFKSRLKKIFVYVDEAKRTGKYIKTEDIQKTNDEGKKYFAVTTSASNNIEVYSKKILQAFIQDTDINQKLIEIACKRVGKVSVQKATMVINSIRHSGDTKLLLDVINDILSYWIISLQKDISTTHSMEFIKKCSAAYSISNTYDIFISDLKDKLNEIIVKYSAEYINTEKKSTVNMFKQTVFLYIIFYISSLN